MRPALPIRRRTVLAGLLSAGAAPARALPVVRLGVLPFGSVQWIADTITHNGLDAAHGFALRTVTLASPEAGKVALLGRSADIAYADWPFVAVQRGHGGHLCLAAGGSAALGGIMVPAASPIRGLADLQGRRLGVAGGAGDKSWLLVRAVARRRGIELAHATTLEYGAPPLLDAMLRGGRLDALLTFWNFAARLAAYGFREALSVADCAGLLGLTAPPALLGYVFDERWAADNRPALAGFLAASAAATDLLARAPAAWLRLRPLMDAPDDKVFAALRARFVSGLGTGTAAMEAQARMLLPILAAEAGQAAPATMPPGTFWRPDAG